MCGSIFGCRFERLHYSVVFLFAPRENMEETSRSVRHRGVANAEQLKIAQRKFKIFDDAAVTEWKRLKELNQKRLLTPEHDACSHARWVHLSDLKNKKG